MVANSQLTWNKNEANKKAKGLCCRQVGLTANVKLHFLYISFGNEEAKKVKRQKVLLVEGLNLQQVSPTLGLHYKVI